MNPAKQFISQFKNDLDSDGKVLAVENGFIRVSTSSGIIKTTLAINSDVSVGDSVKVSNGQIVGRKKRENSIPTFYL